MKRVNFKTRLVCLRQCILTLAILLMTPACGTLQVGIEGNASPAPAQSTAVALATDNARLAEEATALAQPGITETPVPTTPLTIANTLTGSLELLYRQDIQLHARDIATNQDRTLLALPDDVRTAVSPRGFLAYVKESKLYLANLVSGETREVYSASDKTAPDWDLLWSSDGQSLAFVVAYETAEGNRMVDLNTYDGYTLKLVTTLMARSGQEPTGQVPSTPAPGFAILGLLGYNHAAGRILATPLGGAERFKTVQSFDVASGQQVLEQTFGEHIEGMALSPDTTRLAINVQNGPIIVYELGATRVQTRTHALPANTYPGELLWSPDNTHLAFVLYEGQLPRFDISPSKGLYVLNTTGMQATQLNPLDSPEALLLNWLPDGSALLVRWLEALSRQEYVERIELASGQLTDLHLDDTAIPLGWLYTQASGPPPSVTPSPTADSLWSPPQTWERTSVPEAGITFDAPSGWQRLGVEWAWMAGQPEQGGPRLGLNWNDIAPGWEETAMLPNHAVMIAAATEPVDQGWGQSRTYTLEVTGPAAAGGSAAVQSVETHMIIRTGTRAYDIYASAKSYSELTALMPALQHMVASVQLTTPGPATSAPGGQPSLGRLAYVRNGDIWIMDTDHIEPRRLTTDGHHTEPQWSPSGQAIAFRKDGAVWVQRMDTGQAVRMDEDEEAGAVMAAWAPLDRPPYFAKRGELWIVTADGGMEAFSPFMGAQRQILPPGTLSKNGQGQATLRWSTDGWLAWSTPAGYNMDGKNWEQTLFVKSADDDGEPATLQLSADVRRTYYQLIDWVPHSRLILAGRGLMANSLWVDGVPLVTINADSGEVRDLGVVMLLTREAYAWQPGDAWQSGQQPLLAMAEGAGRFLTSNKQLTVLDIATGELSRLTANDQSVFEPAWSPDGKWLAYAANTARPDWQGNGEEMERGISGRSIYIVDAQNPDSGARRQLTQPGAGIDGWPGWSSDGTHLLYTRQTGDKVEIHRVSVDGQQDEVLVDGLEDPTCFYSGCRWVQFMSYQ